MFFNVCVFWGRSGWHDQIARSLAFYYVNYCFCIKNMASKTLQKPKKTTPSGLWPLALAAVPAFSLKLTIRPYIDNQPSPQGEPQRASQPIPASVASPATSPAFQERRPAQPAQPTRPAQAAQPAQPDPKHSLPEAKKRSSVFKVFFKVKNIGGYVLAQKSFLNMTNWKNDPADHAIKTSLETREHAKTQRK